MSDEDEAAGVLIHQKFFEPLNGSQVQMVGRLIEKQRFRLVEEGCGNEDPEQPTTAQLVHRIVHLFSGKSKASQNFTRFPLQFFMGVFRTIDHQALHDVADGRETLVLQSGRLQNGGIQE